MAKKDEYGNRIDDRDTKEIFTQAHATENIGKARSVSKLEQLKQARLEEELTRKREEIKKLHKKTKSAKDAYGNSTLKQTNNSERLFSNAHATEIIGKARSVSKLEQLKQARIDEELTRKRQEIKKKQKELSSAKDKYGNRIIKKDKKKLYGNAHENNNINTVKMKSNQTINEQKREQELKQKREAIKALKKKRKMERNLSGDSNPSKKSSKSLYTNPHENVNYRKRKSSTGTNKSNKSDENINKQNKKKKNKNKKKKKNNKPKPDMNTHGF